MYISFEKNKVNTLKIFSPDLVFDSEKYPFIKEFFIELLPDEEDLLSKKILEEKKIEEKKKKEKEIWLRMPDSWDETRYEALVLAIHNYISAGALYEYFMLVLTSKDPLTIDKYSQLEDAELDIIDAANTMKPGSMVHTLKPFG